jgi:prephenate dehydrogenase
MSSPRAAIAGLGLIGGSIGMALVARGWEIVFIDSAVAEADALLRRAATSKAGSVDAADVDLVVIATPVDAAIALLKSAAFPEGAVITSVCSVMAPLEEVATARGLPFVAGHPFAGSEKSGLEAARGDLFSGSTWFVSAATSYEIVDRLVSDAGAELRRIDAAEHDRLLAITSHLPQILSTALGSVIASDPRLIDFCGPGAKSMLRLAGSSEEVWRPVIEANQPNVARALGELEAALRRIVEGGGKKDFEAAQHLWRQITGDSR